MNRGLLLITVCCFMSIYSQDKNCNCCIENHQKFDFWIGNWKVTNQDGTLAGTNSIDKIQDSCILRESWISAKGKYTGTSHNFYNYKEKQWEQLWIDNQGGSMHLKGNRIGNTMILSTDEEKNESGQSFYNRVSWTLNDDDTVRQLWETIANKNTVKVVFDGLYRKK